MVIFVIFVFFAGIEVVQDTLFGGEKSDRGVLIVGAVDGNGELVVHSA